MDLVPLYPPSLVPQALLQLRAWYIEGFSDPLFTAPPTFFQWYIVAEAVYHLPLSVWAIPALLRDDAMFSVLLLTWAVQTAVTTATCLVHVMSVEDLGWDAKRGLAGLYGTYIAIGELGYYFLFQGFGRDLSFPRPYTPPFLSACVLRASSLLEY